MVAQADPRKYVWDALQAAERASRFTKGRSFDDYLADDMLRAAVERQFEIIGEALGNLRRVAPELAAQIPESYPNRRFSGRKRCNGKADCTLRPLAKTSTKRGLSRLYYKPKVNCGIDEMSLSGDNRNERIRLFSAW
jgi:hypothetical protein